MPEDHELSRIFQAMDAETRAASLFESMTRILKEVGNLGDQLRVKRPFNDNTTAKICDQLVAYLSAERRYLVDLSDVCFHRESST